MSFYLKFTFKIYWNSIVANIIITVSTIINAADEMPHVSQKWQNIWFLKFLIFDIQAKQRNVT